jgi:hypothetical protein
MQLHKTSLVGLAALFALVASRTLAAPVAVTNPGFEDISVGSPYNEFTFGAPAGWQLHDPGLVTDNGDGPTFYIGTLTPFEIDPIGNPGVYVNFPGGAAEGERVGIAFNFDGSDGQGEYGFYQELSATLQPHTTYTLEVEVGNITSGTATNGTFFPLLGFPGYRIELQADGMMLEQDNNLLGGSIPDGQFATSTITYTTGASHTLFDQELGILLVNLNQEDPSFPGSDLEVDFDAVRLSATPAVEGDLDYSGVVDGTDFLVWQRGESDDPLSPTDLALWSANYGVAVPVAAATVPLTAATVPPAAAASPVPEPSALLLTVMGSLVWCGSRSRPARSRR